ncbi:MAG: NeuD/PglB/VioB family sugar acetyltransferase [Rectinemataceae bacterium]
MKKLIIFGGSGIGMIAASVAEDLGYFEVLGFLNDMLPENSMIGKYKKYPVIGKTDDYTEYLKDTDVHFFVAYVGMQNEYNVYKKLESLEIPDERWATLIHPSAIIPKGMCSIGKGVLLAPQAQLSPDTTIGDNCILLGGSFLGHDSTLDRFAHLATNSVVGANVYIGKAVHVGSNATIREKVHIGSYSLIGAGAVVLNDFDEYSIIIGNPAKLLRKTLNDNQETE